VVLINEGGIAWHPLNAKVAAAAKARAGKLQVKRANAFKRKVLRRSKL
jgi:hypothetical protein